MKGITFVYCSGSHNMAKYIYLPFRTRICLCTDLAVTLKGVYIGVLPWQSKHGIAILSSIQEKTLAFFIFLDFLLVFFVLLMQLIKESVCVLQWQSFNFQF